MGSAKRIYALAAAWGIAEATLFFIVPDVLLSWIAIHDLRRALRACAWALAGALVGGCIIWILGYLDPQPVREIFGLVPGISEQMIADVRQQLDSRGLMALFIGPLIGTPYKIYAVEAAGAGFGLLVFLLVSIPARLMRFLVVTLVAGFASHVLRRFVTTRVLLSLHVILWVGFYAWYFSVMGVY